MVLYSNNFSHYGVGCLYSGKARWKVRSTKHGINRGERLDG